MFFSPAFAAILIETVLALPAPMEKASIPTVKGSNDIDLPFYYPAVEMATFSIKPTTGLKTLNDNNDRTLAESELLKRLNLSKEELEIKDSHRDSAGVLHVYARQLVDGIPIDNRNAAIHIQDGQVLAFSSSFTDIVKMPSAPNSPQPLSLDECVKIAEEAYGIKRDNFPATNVFVQLPDHTLSLSYQFQLRNEVSNQWLQVSVDSQTGQIVQAIDFTAEAVYKVLPLPKVDPTEDFESVNPSVLAASSPSGWHSDGNKTYTDTQGNNLISAINGKTADGGDNLEFTHEWDPTQEPNTPANQRAAIINNFYTSNMLHDISYQFGFDEKSGNFQQNNFEKGGKGNDRVVIKNQAYGTNNANFATPPDGQSGVMQMYIWTKSTPKRDGSLENDIPLHEGTHGISNRLTGGSAQANCLFSTSARGMGEGWSDTVAVYLNRKVSDTRDNDAVLGAYAYNKVTGIRSKPYSTDLTRNPYTLSYVGTQNEVHAIGEYWANVLFEMYWNLVDAKGFSPNWLDATQDKGNIIALQLVIGGMKLQPCNPNFTSARDAILAADQSYYGGSHKCLIWKAFAKRGLGVDSSEKGFLDGFKLPEDC